jgi:Rrf2 family transcriptional regulator, iron-sulfur cluster assembly transcription factor
MMAGQLLHNKAFRNMTIILINGMNLGSSFPAASRKEQTMHLTMAGEYAIRTMMDLSARPFGATVSIPAVAAQWDIPESYLRKISAQLAKARLLTTHRGVGGGLSLARPAEEITLLDVMEAVEGPLSLNRCLIDTRACSRTERCAVHRLWAEGQEKLKETLRGRSLAELAQRTGPAADPRKETPEAVLSFP